MTRSSYFLLSVASALVAQACVTDHDVLGEQGAGGSGNDASGVVRVPKDASADASPEAAARPPPPAGDTGTPPPGVRSLTFVNGVTDSPWAAFCLSVASNGKTRLLSAPFPEGGLPYGHSVRLDDETLVALATDGLGPTLVLASSADAVAGLDCAHIFTLAASLVPAESLPDASASRPTRDGGRALDGGRPDATAGDAGARDATTPMDASSDGATSLPTPPIARVRVAPLPLVPPGALAEARAYLLVAGGCAGGPGVVDPSQQSVCGELYSPSTPTLSEFVVAPRAVAPDGRVGLTVLGGTPALTQVDLGLVPGLHGDLITVATKVVPGALRPLASYTGATQADIDATSPDSLVELFAFGSDVPAYQQSWAPTLAAGGVPALENGKSYSLIVIGPFPGFARRNWWNDPLVTIVENR